MTKWSLMWVVCFSVLSMPTQAFENAIGVELGNANANGDACRTFPPGSGCKDNHDSFRFYYGARFTPDWELRITYTSVDVRVTNSTDPIFNIPDATTDITDIAALYRWHVANGITIEGKAGLALWEEIDNGPGFFGGESSSGVGPVLGVGAEFGNRLVRFTLTADLYPSIGDSERVTVVGAGLRFVW